MKLLDKILDSVGDEYLTEIGRSKFTTVYWDAASRYTKKNIMKSPVVNNFLAVLIRTLSCLDDESIETASSMEIIDAIETSLNGTNDEISKASGDDYAEAEILAEITTIVTEQLKKKRTNMITRAIHYYESHVTLEPVFDQRLNTLQEIAAAFNFRVADLLLQKPQGNDKSTRDSFCTYRGVWLEKTRDNTINFVKALQKAGYEVWRYKIEDTILDSRIEDEFDLLKKDDVRTGS